MGAPGWQDIAVGALVLAAAGWLVRRAWLRRRRGAGCEDCPGCAPGAATGAPGATAPPVVPPPLVQITGVRHRHGSG